MGTGQIKLSCSCPDWADMCKHVAAVLYGVGARLDHKPQLLFVLRGVDENDLIAGAGSGLALPKAAPGRAKMLDEGATSRRCSGWKWTIPPRPAPAIGDAIDRIQRMEKELPLPATITTSFSTRSGP
jgi:uncharacterized Zn finger protein